MWENRAGWRSAQMPGYHRGFTEGNENFPVPWPGGSGIRASPHRVKGRQFDCGSGHMPGLRTRSLAEVTNPRFSHSQEFFSLSFSLPSPVSKHK